MTNYLTLAIILLFSLSLVAAGQPNLVPATSKGVVDVIVPPHAIELAPGIFSLGTAQDVDGRIVEGFLFIDNRKEFARGTCNNNNICEPELGEKNSCSDCKNGGGEDPTPTSTCFSTFAKGASWKDTEPYITGAGVNLALTEISLNTWDSEVSFNIFGIGSSGDTDGADSGSPDGKNEVMFENLGASNTIAYTIVWGVFRGPPQGRKLVEWDAVFNLAYDWSETGEAGKMDYQNIATHEFGHSLGLTHPSDDCTEETMFRFAGFGETNKRSLAAGDIAGVNSLY